MEAAKCAFQVITNDLMGENVVDSNFVAVKSLLSNGSKLGDNICGAFSGESDFSSIL